MNTSTPQAARTCDQCGKPLSMDARAPHKRFCDLTCKDTFHRENRKAGEAARMALKGAA